MKFPRYFETYGGLNAIARSPYAYLSLGAVAVCYRFYTSPNWWDLAIAVIPGLVGFSIAGVAIFISLGSDSLRAVIAGQEQGSNKPSPFISFMAMFTHFIVIQLIALLCAVVSKALFEAAPIPNNPLLPVLDELKTPFWLAGGFFFSYAIFLCVALAAEIYRLALMIDAFQTRENRERGD